MLTTAAAETAVALPLLLRLNRPGPAVDSDAFRHSAPDGPEARPASRFCRIVSQLHTVIRTHHVRHLVRIVFVHLAAKGFDIEFF